VQTCEFAKRYLACEEPASGKGHKVERSHWPPHSGGDNHSVKIIHVLQNNNTVSVRSENNFFLNLQPTKLLPNKYFFLPFIERYIFIKEKKTNKSKAWM
jgi:hypothetical protein